ncbi:hypothetical protein EVAR_19904_1 [Eumeta japonica]|uniref:Uncharacterized protein n=1 Tax=Eumeta variegata TaxID=151549 RepID=A0A4C1XN71_EUMVA|nr:hypothetical protein EVAR_19904_1 [Eumeta japonica]
MDKLRYFADVRRRYCRAYSDREVWRHLSSLIGKYRPASCNHRHLWLMCAIEEFAQRRPKQLAGFMQRVRLVMASNGLRAPEMIRRVDAKVTSENARHSASAVVADGGAACGLV